MTTDPSKLPQHNGRPVPWITRWTGEVIQEPYTLEMTRAGLRLVYPDGKDGDYTDGALWQREGLRRGGEPQYAQVSTYRQRKAMRRGHCQVCGDKITEKPMRFLMPLFGLEELDENTHLTTQAPTCSECIPLALQLCPHLKHKGYQLLKVIDYDLWGFFGEVVYLQEGQVRRMRTFVGMDQHNPPQFSLSQVLAKQQVIKLNKFVIEETLLPKGKAS